MLKIITMTVLMTLLALADGPVLKTGQVTSYDEDGTRVSDGSIKDDGYYQLGAARSYSRRGDVVIDNTTGLEWQDTEVLKKAWITRANWDAKNYNDTSGDTAASYCTKLILDGDDWRLPSIEELQTLVDNGYREPSVTPGTFNNFPLYDYDYWSNAYVSDATKAWFVAFSSGYSGTTDKFLYRYVRCVRGDLLELSDLSRNPNTQIVTDSTTGLQWQDDADADTIQEHWIGAIDYCENTLELGGYDDWRLPNKNELISIADHTAHDPAINTSVFQNTDTTVIGSTYWTSSSKRSYTENAWKVQFIYGRWINDPKNYHLSYIRCVRGEKLGSPVNPSIIMYLLN